MQYRPISWRSTAQLGALAAALGFACGDNQGDPGERCTEGLAGCACIQGLCLSDLECIDDVCTDPGRTSGTATVHMNDPVTDEGSEVTGVETGDFCQDNGDCDAREVCIKDTECVDAIDRAYSLNVNVWNPDGCEGLEDYRLYYKVKIDGVVQATSGESECPGTWAEFTEYEPTWRLELELWKTSDFNGEALITNLCFKGDDGKCGVVPVSALHDGGYTGAVGDTYLDLLLYPDP